MQTQPKIQRKAVSEGRGSVMEPTDHDRIESLEKSVKNLREELRSGKQDETGLLQAIRDGLTDDGRIHMSAKNWGRFIRLTKKPVRYRDLQAQEIESE